MKKALFVLSTLFISLTGFAQENALTLSGGYAFVNVIDYDENATGFRINGLYEFNPNQSFFAHGLSFGYIHTSTSFSTILGESTIKLNTLPLYYAPKIMFGNDKFKGFVKGALGAHRSGYKTEGILEYDTYDFGFYGGAGLGGIYNVNESIFINIEYEWAYLSNSWYEDGFMNTAQLGIGYKF